MSKKCIHCGIDLEDNQLFCSDCGTKQEESTIPATKKSNKKALTIAGIALGVCAVLLAVLLILKPTWLGFEPKEDDPSEQDQGTTIPDGSNPTPTNPDGKAGYTVSIKTIGGRPVSKHTFSILNPPFSYTPRAFQGSAEEG